MLCNILNVAIHSQGCYVVITERIGVMMLATSLGSFFFRFRQTNVCFDVSDYIPDTLKCQG